MTDPIMETPEQRRAEVVVAHRFGYWMTGDPDEVSTEMIAEADAYLEEHILWRIEQALAEHDAEETT